MATAGSTHHVRLTTAAGGTEIGLMLAHDPEGRALYVARRLPLVPTRPLIFEQNSWHLGFGDYFCRGRDPYRYAFSDGVDARYPNGLQLIPNIEGPLDVLVRNPGGEQNSTSIWTAGTGVTYTNPTTNPRSGSRHHRIVTDGSRSSDDVLLSFSLASPAVYDNPHTITVGCYVAAAGGRTLRIDLYDGTTAHAGDTTTSSSYTYIAVTTAALPGGGASEVTIRIVAADGDGGSARTHDMDDAFALYNASAQNPLDMLEFSDDFLAVSGHMMLVWDEDTKVFNASVLVSGGVKNLALHGGLIYAARGATYLHSATGLAASWTSVTPTTGAADLVVSAVDELGVRRLFRVDKPNQMYVSNETFGSAIGVGDWNATIYTVGETDKAINTVFNAFDTILVGREDGLFYFYAPDNKFVSGTEQLIRIPDTENFERGLEYIDGWFYITTARYGLSRISFRGGDMQLEPVPPRYAGPMYDDYGSRVRALTHDGFWLYALQDRPVSDATATKTVNLLAAKNELVPSGGIELVWHTLRAIGIGKIGSMAIHADNLYLAGTLYNSDLAGDGDSSSDGYIPVFFRMALPTQHQSMMKEATVNVEAGGTKTFVTCIMDFAEEGWGHDDKEWIKVELNIENLSADITLAVEEQKDDAISDSGSWTAVGSALTGVTRGWATVAFTSTTVAKRLRLRLTFVTNVTTSGPVVRGYRVTAVPRPDKYWTWDLTARVGTGVRMLTGARESQTAQNILSNLDTLGNGQLLKFNDLDNIQYDVQLVGIDKAAAPRAPQSGAGGAEHLEQQVRLLLREVLTS